LDSIKSQICVLRKRTMHNEDSLSTAEKERYSRHLALPDFDEHTQIKLKNARVLVTGCGGLAHPVLQYLVAAGTGIIGIADDDVVHISNLQRQVLFSEKDIGKSKIDVVIERLQPMNRAVKFQTHNTRIISENALQIIQQYDIVVDCADNFPTKYLLSDACVLLGKPCVFGAIYRYEGQVSLFNSTKNINYRDVYPTPPPNGSILDCEEGGIIGVLAGLIGCMQANETIKWITGIGECLDGKLLIYDAQSGLSDIIQIRSRSDNPVSGEHPTLTGLTDYDAFCNAQNKKRTSDMVKEISVQELKALMDSDEDFQLIDVREPEEFEEVNMEGELIPMNTIPEHVQDIARDKKVVIHCKGGTRSGNVIEYLQAQHGFSNLYNLKGGIMEWKKNYM